MLDNLVGLIARFDMLFARGGGGGSGGDGDGGGIALLAMVGYVPAHAVGAIIRKLKNKESEWVGGQVVGWVLCTVYTVALLALTQWIGIYALIMAAGAPLGMGAGLYSWFSKLRQSKHTKAALVAAAQGDRAWDEQKLIAHAKAVFMRYQQDWTSFNTESMRAYMTEKYWYHAALMVYALQLAQRQNVVSNIAISDALVVHVVDNPGASGDTVVVGIAAKATDQTIDRRDNKVLFTDNKPFTEFYQFSRSGDNWLLNGIQQATASEWVHNPELERFAASQGYYFSLDWGWLLIPRRGQLFGTAKFGVSDINNHVIGMYNKCLVQLYTYSAQPENSAYGSYLIAQANVPKSYGNIVVRRKKGLFGRMFGIRGLKHVSLEWREFNDKYDVYATSAEQATSFELLHPAFMEKLEALPFEVSIEVVDNVVYLYAPEKVRNQSPDRYASMLAVLREAFKQMRL